ncbi:MAG: transposase [Nitrospirales bacterium]
MEKQYRHLDHKERTLIYWWRNEQLTLREIGRRLRRSHTSISRELKRNAWRGKPYFSRGAQQLAACRLRHRATRDRLNSPLVRAYVHQKVPLGWTPELIARRLKRQGQLPSVCHEAIYQYIYTRALELRAFLPRHHHKRKPKRPYRKTGERIKH